MGHDHNNNGHKENKPVAFTTPLICGLVAVFIILAFTSLGNPCHHKNECCTGKECSKECMEKCEKGDHKECKDMEGHEASAKHEEHATESAVAETPAVADSAKAEEPAKEEVKHEEAHH